MAYCVIVVLLLADIKAVCSNGVSSINQLFHENFYMLYARKSHEERYFQYCVQEFSLQYFPVSNFAENIPHMCSFKYMLVTNVTLKVAMKKSSLKPLHGGLQVRYEA